MTEPFATGLRVRYGECDAQAVVFNAHYLAYVDIAITELWREAFGSYGAMLEHEVDVVVAEARLSFRAPARFDDELRIEVIVEHLGTTSIVTRHRVMRGEDELVEVQIRHVTVDPRTLGKIPIPSWMREGLSPWASETSGPG